MSSNKTCILPLAFFPYKDWITKFEENCYYNDNT